MFQLDWVNWSSYEYFLIEEVADPEIHVDVL